VVKKPTHLSDCPNVTWPHSMWGTKSPMFTVTLSMPEISWWFHSGFPWDKPVEPLVIKHGDFTYMFFMAGNVPARYGWHQRLTSVASPNNALVEWKWSTLSIRNFRNSDWSWYIHLSSSFMSYQLVSTSETAFWAVQCLKCSQNLENIPVWMKFGWPTGWGNPMNTIVIRCYKYHKPWLLEFINQLSYQTGAPHCSIHSVIWLSSYSHSYSFLLSSYRVILGVTFDHHILMLGRATFEHNTHRCQS